MPAITFSDFSGGLDRRLPVTVQDSSRLWVLREAYITTGKRIRKRPGLKLIAGTLSGTVGLAAVSGRLKTFANIGDTVTATPQVDVLRLNVPSGLTAGQHLQRVYSASMFNGFVYVVAEYDPEGVYVGGVSEGNTGGENQGRVPTPRPPIPGPATA
jgi:hypothetical protein